MTLTSATLLLLAGVLSVYLARGLVLAYAKRNPYFHLGDYMERFWVRRHNETKSNHAVRIHNIKRSDYDRALHDHPWNNWSLVLRNGYWEIVPGAFQSAFEDGSIRTSETFSSLQQTIASVPGGKVPRAQREAFATAGVHWRGTGAFVRRTGTSLHRLVIPAGTDAWSLFGMGPKYRDWGFLTPEGWVHNEKYIKELGREA